MDRLIIIAKGFLKLPHLHILIKQKSPSLGRNLALGTWLIANSVLDKGKSAMPPLFSSLEVMSSASDKAKLFAENFSKNSNRDDFVICLPVLPSRTNVKLHNISVSPTMVKKIIMNHDF